MSPAYDEESEIEGSRAPLMDHLIELRRRLITCIAALAIGFLVCFFTSQYIFDFLIHPFQVAQQVVAERKGGEGHGQSLDLLLTIMGLKTAPPGSVPDLRFVYTGALELFFAKVKLAVFGGVVLSFPVLAWQLYRFVAPGLYRRERMAFAPFLLAAPVLFVAGAALVYYVMLPFVLWFSLTQQVIGPHVKIELLPRISEYLDLVTKLVLAFGLCFQLPVVLTLCGQAGLISAETLSKGRRYAFVGIVVVAALVTPPDMISPFLLAGPIYLLYEGSIWCVRLIEMRRDRQAKLEAKNLIVTGG